MLVHNLANGTTRRIGMKMPRPARNRTSRVGNLAQDCLETPRYVVADQLRDLLARDDTPAAARVNAARTLAEIEGLIGRHQTAPEKGTTAPLSSLSRDQLQDELNRLRTLFDLGLIT